MSLHVFLANLNYTFVNVGIKDNATKLSDKFGLVVSHMVSLRALDGGRWQNPSLVYGAEEVGQSYSSKIPQEAQGDHIEPMGQQDNDKSSS
ncbi:hypothetical protein NL676_014028 [Syzygium grande]|nr:hypothetical protein NL676_014028 [Syzygium grande]